MRPQDFKEKDDRSGQDVRAPGICDFIYPMIAIQQGMNGVERFNQQIIPQSVIEFRSAKLKTTVFQFHQCGPRSQTRPTRKSDGKIIRGGVLDSLHRIPMKQRKRSS
ncbi:hypothetical protein NITGR_150028 [Nitrospina gracilis 3/211]|uniref:Uncharacterized protein n=1 Tax=Nitrospina gracilis (strain 3/211) TaxID=1266370 RepID=M1YGX0_NITG3|nr:hypothetical protein NITGR_150028 [Nitrospina gracilis 3/211]